MSQLEDHINGAVRIICSAVFDRERVLAEIRCYPNGNLKNRVNLGIDALANQIVGELLNAGWTPPTDERCGGAS